MSKINVIYLSHEAGTGAVGGASFSLLNLINSVTSTVHPIVLCISKGSAYDFFCNHGIETYCVPFPKGTIYNGNLSRKIFIVLPKFIHYWYSILKANRLCSKLFGDRKISIVHTNTAVLDYGYYLSKNLHASHVWHLREHLDLGVPITPFLGYRRLKLLINQSDFVISISDSIQEYYSPNPSKSIVLKDAVRSSNEACITSSKSKYFLFCGRLYDNKGAHIAVEAFVEFCKLGHDDYKLVLAGPYEEEYKVKLDAIAGPYIDKIEYLGFVSETTELFKNATALLMCSENEGLGRVTIEAMFYGCPVIGRDLSATSEIVRDGINGYKFLTVEECSQCMHKVVMDANKTKELVSNAQQYAIENYSEEEYGKQLIKIYELIRK